MELLELAKAVKRGARLLDKKVPMWRRVMRRHAATFDIGSTRYCVLGTLEHHVGRLRVLANKCGLEAFTDHYTRGLAALHITDPVAVAAFGFNGRIGDDYEILQALWRAEFER